MGHPSNREAAAAFGEALTDALWERRMRAADLARACGVSRQAMSNYTRGLRVPSPEAAERMAAALGVDPSRLAPGEGAAGGGD